MKSDLTILYYTANRLSLKFTEAVFLRLRKSTQDRFPMVIVSQNHDEHDGPAVASMMKKGTDIHDVGQVPPSIYQVYRNVLTGARAAKTLYVACCEDDTLYSQGHFQFRPPLDTFAYNHMRYVITRKLADDGKQREAFFYFRERTQMAMCIAPRELLIETLQERFAKYPTPVPHDVAKRTGWGEPGRYERNLGLTPRKLMYFRSAQPNVTFNHSSSLMGRRKVNPDDVIAQAIEPWGDANELWNTIKGED